MFSTIETYLRTQNIPLHTISTIPTVTISKERGVQLVNNLLTELVDMQTILLLSGGRTPKELYEVLAKDERLHPGVVGQVDERYGDPFHEQSNQKIITESGLTRYLQMRDIPFYPMLKFLDRPTTATEYDKTLRDLFSVYRKSIGILGIGLDGHTAGLPASESVWTEFDIEERSKTEYVIDYDDHGVFYNERVTMTTTGLSMLDLYIVLVFGDDKKEALASMVLDGSEQEIPSRFYTRPNIAKKTLLITDQEI